MKEAEAVMVVGFVVLLLLSLPPPGSEVSSIELERDPRGDLRAEASLVDGDVASAAGNVPQQLFGQPPRANATNMITTSRTGVPASVSGMHWIPSVSGALMSGSCLMVHE